VWLRSTDPKSRDLDISTTHDVTSVMTLAFVAYGYPTSKFDGTSKATRRELHAAPARFQVKHAEWVLAVNSQQIIARPVDSHVDANMQIPS
jgi:hypothetical protein